MRIRVLRRHINKGRRYKYLSCPVALAIREATGKKVKVKESSLERGKNSVVSPHEVTDFVCQFDLGEPVSPFTFTLDNKLIK